jgi:hypothetical protein
MTFETIKNMAIQALRNRYKMKDDAIAQLSDQTMAMSTRLQEKAINLIIQIITR